MVKIVSYTSYLTNEAKNINADLEKRYLLFGLWGVVTRIPAYTENDHKILRNYAAPNGKVPFSEWLSSLKDPSTRLRIRRRLDRLELGNVGDCKSVGAGVSELRLAFGSGYRIYFAEQDDIIIILLCAGDKSTQKKDIKTAQLYWQELKERSDE